jgi:hypothetical protein
MCCSDWGVVHPLSEAVTTRAVSSRLAGAADFASARFAALAGCPAKIGLVIG